MSEHQEYKGFLQKRQILEEIIKDQLLLLNYLNMKGWIDTINHLQERVKSDNFKVLVLGEFKRGKSTFINALLGEEILPSYAKPCTAIINEIKWGETRRALLYFNPDDQGNIKPPQEIPVDEIEDYVVIKDGVNEREAIHNTPYEKVEIFWQLELCKNGVEIIDSPGLNENEIRQKVTLDYLSTVDAILFVLSCEALASMEEVKVIKNTLINAGHKDIFFICNRFDAIRKREREDLKNYGIAQLAPLTEKGAKRVFFISSLNALEGRLEEDQDLVGRSGILPLEKDLQEFLINDKGRVKLIRPGMELRRSIQEARRIILERKTLLRTDIKTLEERYIEAQKPLKQLEMQRQQITNRINNFLGDMRLAVRVETQNFYIELADKKINEWIESYEIKEPIEFFKFEFITTQIERVVTEITEYFTQQIESELGDWQNKQLEPIIKQKLESLMFELDTKATDFIKNVDNLRLQIAPDSFDTSTIFDPEKKVSAVERIIATAGGFVIGGLGSAAVGAVFGYQEMLKSILPQLGLAIGAIILGFTSPWVLIPLLMGGGLVQGILKMKATNDQVKQTIAKEYIKQIRSSNYEQSNKIADSVVEKLRDFQNKIDQGLEKEIQSIRDQVNSVLEEKQKGQSNVDQKLQELENIEKQMNQLDSKLDEFIAKIALG
ncbi:dynamin family protein [Cuspidothrix issatschenkoi LEGE 03284]|uniref:dynamin family protein n=1 Tax=Cuspidothrix issatschenkoi TaxID=230752 RepID=UPI001882468A|nr:dynamin family protein [Cuspidothrix issatschenkoi]MBE9230125.1 dynamin family protein [Cuspidothrix issatschenkoi LEGE 03284]